MIERQFYLFIAFLCLLSSSAFGQKGVTRIYTDYGGYWTSAAGAINPVYPDNKHNLLGFIWDGITYSTGVNDPLLISKGVAIVAQLYQAFPVNNITLNGLDANYVALGYKEDGDPVSGKYPYTIPVKISEILNRGINGLDMGSGITNIPASAEPLLFNFGGVIDLTQIGDRVPDLLISQIASPVSTNLDKVWFEDINHNRVGNEVSVDMGNANVPSVGNWTLDLYSPVTGIIGPAKTDRPIRIWAADASLFGLNNSNYLLPVYLRYKLGGSSDPAFLAFNRRFIEIIDANDDAASTEVNTPVNIDVLANDGPSFIISPPTLRILQNPLHGTATVVIQNGKWVIKYQPAQGYGGTDSFTYQVSNDASTPSSGSAKVTLTVVIPIADLAISKTMDNSTLNNNTASFKLTITNNGPSTAPKIVVKDVLPSGYNYVSSSAQTGSYSVQTGEWHFNSLAVGSTATLTINTTLNLTGTYENTGNVSSDATDPQTANNTSSTSPQPLPPTGAAQQSFCENDLPTLAALRVTGTNIKWYISATGGVAIANATILTNGNVYFASQTIAGAESATRLPIQVTLIPTPAAPLLTTQTPVIYCLNDPAIPLQAQVTTGNTLLWYTVPVAGTAQPTAPTPQTNIASRTTYYVSQRNTFGCEGPRTAILVIVNPLPAAPLSGGDQTLCETGLPLVLTATASTPAGYSILWYNSSNQIVSQPVLSTAGSITYYAASRNNVTGCVSIEKTPVKLTINPAPPMPVSGGNQAICPSVPVQTLTATATAVAGNDLIWYDALREGNRVTNPILNTEGTITYYAAAKSLATGCESLERSPVTLTINPPANASVRIDQPTCDQRTGKIHLTSTTGVSFSISTVSRPFSVTNTTGEFTGLEPGEYTAMVTTINGCKLTLPVITIDQPFCPSVNLTKVADNTGSKAGDIVNYTLTVKNTGNVPLTDMQVSDDGADRGSISPASSNISVGQSLTVRARHTLTQADVDRGNFSNQASVKGLAPNNTAVTDPLSDDPQTTRENDPTIVQISAAPGITLVKTGALSADYETVNYTFTIQNTGTVTLFAVNLKDEKLGLNKIIQTQISPGRTITHTESYPLTVADKNNRSITNTATVTASSPNGTPVTDISGTQQNNDLPTVVQIPTEAAVSLVKTASLTGNTITYTFTVFNTGKLSLSTIALSDPKVGWDNKALDGIILPGSSLSFNATYQLTQADKEQGTVTNTAIVNAVTQGGVIVNDWSGTEISNNLPTTINVPSPPIAIDDQAETKANSSLVIDILKNDDPLNSSFDRSSIVIISPPKNGILRVNLDGTVTYNPSPGFTGKDSFSYRASDISGYQSNIAEVTISSNFSSLIIANTFTPNGDGKNDYFNIVGLNQYADNELTVFTRWGGEVYRKKDYENNWTGEGLGEGTYFYLLKVKQKGGTEYEVFKGWVLLKRAYIK